MPSENFATSRVGLNSSLITRFSKRSGIKPGDSVSLVFFTSAGRACDCRGFKRFSESEVCVCGSSPEGRGCREAAGEGYKNEIVKYVVPLTRPAGAGHPLPSGEGFAEIQFSIWTVQPGQEGRWDLASYRGVVPVTRQMVLPTSSATSRAPCASIATPTGLPIALPSSVTNPPSTSMGSPDGRPPENGTKITL